MELIWKNETGSVLGKRSYNPDETNVHEVIAETDWIFGPGDVIELHEEPINLDDIFKYMEDKINDCFYDFQTKLGITSGDIEPYDAVNLEDKTKALCEVIKKVLGYEMMLKEMDENNEQQ